MLFNSAIFPCFFILVFVIYLGLMRKHTLQNVWLLLASYVFYGWWDWRFLSLLFVSTLTDYVIAIAIAKSNEARKRRMLLLVSLVINLGILGFFKYFNFFVDSFEPLLNIVGLDGDWVTMTVILPVGISFYTFQSLSYTIDVYRGALVPCRRFEAFALYVSFFPQLVAGPIERATQLLPQIQNRRRLLPEQIHAGLYLILWGYCKKMVIADNMAIIAGSVFAPGSKMQGMEVILGILAFSAQIYCDFSGYSDIARGLAKLMGFELMVNFRLPYFAISPSDFWQRWHISLSSWLRDYLYIPLGGNRCSKWRCSMNLVITMLLGGLWHGASWNFIIWGAYHGLLLLIYRHVGGLNLPTGKTIGWLHVLPRMLLMFLLTLAGWMIFRCRNVEQILDLTQRMSFEWSSRCSLWAGSFVVLLGPLLLVQIIQQYKRDLLWIPKLSLPASALTMAMMIVWLVIFGVRQSTEFIYFQF